MEDIIKELVRIEELAQGITKDMQASKDELPERIKRRRREIDGLIEAEASRLMEADQERCRGEAEDAIREILRRTQEDFAKIETEFFENGPSREDEILKRVIKLGMEG